MSTALLVLLALAAVLVDIAFAPGATLLGMRPQLTLVTVALWAALRPSAEVMLLAPVAGLLLGLLSSEPLGVSVLALAPVVVFSSFSPQRSTGRRLGFSIGLVIAGTLAYALVHLVFSRLLGQAMPIGFGTVWRLFALAVVNSALAAVLYFPLARMSGDPSVRTELRRS